MILNQYKPVLSMKHKEIFCFVIIIILCPQKLCHLATGKRFDIFSKLFLQWVGIHEENSPVHGRCSIGVMRSVAGPHPFFKTLIIYKITTKKWLNIFA